MLSVTYNPHLSNNKNPNFGTNLTNLSLQFKKMGVPYRSKAEEEFLTGISAAQIDLFENGLKDTIDIGHGEVGEQTYLLINYFKDENPKQNILVDMKMQIPNNTTTLDYKKAFIKIYNDVKDKFNLVYNSQN